MSSPGEKVRGRIEAESSSAALAELTQRGYHILKIEESAKVREPRDRRLKLRDVAFVSQQLARLLRSGVPLLKALSILEGRIPSKVAKATLADLRTRIQEGSSFSAALAMHRRSFGSWYVSLVRAGETGGMLDQVLQRLADLIYQEVNLRSRIRAALAYPALMVVMGIVTVFFLLSFVFPKVTVLFSDARQALPLPTLVLMKISGFFAAYWWGVIIAAAIAVLLFRMAMSTERVRRVADRIILSVPLFGQLTIKTEIGRFARVLGTLLANGVPMLQALEVTGATLENAVLRASVKEMGQHVRQGEALSRQMAKERWFPELMVSVLAVGEESGRLDESLLEVAQEYDVEVQRSLATMVSMLEPALIIVVGGAVGFIVMALLLPIFELNEVIQ